MAREPGDEPQPDPQGAETIEPPEPWEAWESRLCGVSVVLGAIGLGVLGVVVDVLFLGP